MEEGRLSLYFCNPNIAPRDELLRRRAEVRRFAASARLPLIESEADPAAWITRVAPLGHLGERSDRCRECIAFRLADTFAAAARLGADAVTTTLTVSPHKDAAMIFEIGERLARERGIPFLSRDFKKRDGYRRSVAYSRSYGFYRQEYCGCVFSRRERLARAGADTDSEIPQSTQAMAE